MGGRSSQMLCTGVYLLFFGLRVSGQIYPNAFFCYSPCSVDGGTAMQNTISAFEKICSRSHSAFTAVVILLLMFIFDP